MKTVEQRFRAKVDPANAEGCHLWTAYAGPDGYGQIGVDGRLVKAHRFAWALANGPIPSGMCVCHKCDTPGCCNPEHLFLGTRADNNADKVAKGRGRCGGVRGTRHGMAKLTEAEAVEIFHAAGTQVEIGARYGVSHTQVSYIKRGLKWRHATQGLAA